MLTVCALVRGQRGRPSQPDDQPQCSLPPSSLVSMTTGIRWPFCVPASVKQIAPAPRPSPLPPSHPTQTPSTSSAASTMPSHRSAAAQRAALGGARPIGPAGPLGLAWSRPQADSPGGAAKATAPGLERMEADGAASLWCRQPRQGESQSTSGRQRGPGSLTWWCRQTPGAPAAAATRQSSWACRRTEPCPWQRSAPSS